MTGLNLETFLQLLRVAPGAWASLGVALIILALMTWTSWGSRRALRKCLFLSIAAHFALIFYGGSSPEHPALLPARLEAAEARAGDRADQGHVGRRPAAREPRSGARGRRARPVSAWDRGGELARPGRDDRLCPAPTGRSPSAALQPEPPKAAGPACRRAAPETGDAGPRGPSRPLRRRPARAQAPEPIADAVDPGEAVVAAPPESAPVAEATSVPLAGSVDLRGRPPTPGATEPRAAPSPSLRSPSPPRSLPPAMPPPPRSAT